MNIYIGKIEDLEPNQIFVFGSNTQGRHGKGSALLARQKFGAIYGQAKGLQGQSYAIVTKDLTKSVHPSISSAEIRIQIRILYQLALETPDKEYIIAYSGEGTNLNGNSPKEMALFFAQAYAGLDRIPKNIIFELTFAELFKEIIK